jgi:hypothetical protein
MRTVPACRSTAPQGRAHASDTRSPQRNLKRKRRRSRRASRPGKTATRAASGLAVGTPWGDSQGRRATATRLPGPQPGVAKMGAALGEETPRRMQRRGGQAGGVAAGEEDRQIMGGGRGELGGHDCGALGGQRAQEAGHPAGTGLQGGRGIALGGQRGERREEARLMQGTAGRERRVLRLGPRTIPGILSWRLGHQAHSLEDSEDCRHNWPSVSCEKMRPRNGEDFRPFLPTQ